MNDKEQYKQKYLAQLEEWKGELQKLKTRALSANAEVKKELDKAITTLEGKFEEATDKVAELTAASESALESVKHGVESAWSSLKTSLQEAAAKFKD